jgi:hypothetical protein
VETGGVLIAVRCAGCAVIFYVCERDYRGQIYGSRGCQRAGRRSANARHQASPEGRLDHRDAMRVHRDRRRVFAAPVTDTRSDKLSAEVSSCVRNDASAPALEAHAVAAESTCDATIDSDDAASAARDAAPCDGVDGGDFEAGDGELPARRGGAGRGRASSAAPAGAVCCVVCRRPGLFIRDAEGRRPRLRYQDRTRRRRGRVPRPPSARAPDPRRRRLR